MFYHIFLDLFINRIFYNLFDELLSKFSSQELIMDLKNTAKGSLILKETKERWKVL